MFRLTLIGHLGKDAELKQIGNQQMAEFSVAVKVGYKEKERTEWIRCALWGDRASKLIPILLKGARVLIEGEPSIRSYEAKNGGGMQVSWQCMVSNIEIVQWANSEPKQQQNNGYKKEETNPKTKHASAEAFGAFENMPIMSEEDIPF